MHNQRLSAGNNFELRHIMDAHTNEFISRIDEGVQFMVYTALTAVRDGSPQMSRA